jgi:glycosyltransferase involved in cell wall biosynthesis
MNIGFDAKRAFMNQSGLGNYSRHLIEGMIDRYRQDNFILYTPQQKIKFVEPVTPQVSIIEPSHWWNRWLHAFWRTYRMVDESSFKLLHVYHGLSAELPQTINQFKGKKVVTIHDLIFEYYPQYYPVFDRWVYRKKNQHACEAADVIICTSNQTKNDLIERYHVTENKIKVIYQICDERFYNNKVTNNGEIDISSLGISKPFIISVSSFNPRKNQLRLIEAFAKANLAADYQLVLAGSGKMHIQKAESLIRQLKLEQKVIILSNLSNDWVVGLYKKAHAMAYVSEYEGFGIPILEGFASGIPVLTSNTSSMKEIGMGAAILVNPFDVEEISVGLQQLVGDTQNNQRLVTAGLKKLKNEFSKKQFIENSYQTYL